MNTRALVSLREVLRTSGFTARAVEQMKSVGQHLPERDLCAVAVALALDENEDQRLAALVALFQLGVGVERKRLRALFSERDLEGLIELELLRAHGEQLVSSVRIDELEGLLLAADMQMREADSVVGVSPSTRLSAAYTPRVGVEAALDMGTGSGAHALLAARHAEKVVATDTSRRALRMTRLNAALNGIENVQTREGSWFEPVAGERFDLVVANLPYGISPDMDFLYRDAGMRGDALCRTALRDLPALLNEGGFASFQGNWTHDRDTRWWSTPAACLATSDCDAFLVRIGTDDPLEYAVRWTEPHYRGDPYRFESAVRRWRESYREDRIEAITTAMVVLRRRAGTNWRRAVTRRELPPSAMGRCWPRLFEAQDRLESLDTDGLLSAHMRPVTGLRVELHAGDPALCALLADTTVTERRPVSRDVAELVLTLDRGGRPADILAGEAIALEELASLVKLGFLELI